MTPLANRIVKHLTMSGIDHPMDKARISRRMGDVHCFEVSALSALFDAKMIEAISDGTANLGKLAFLPANNTWIEETLDGGDGVKLRVGYLLSESNDKTRAHLSVAHLLEPPTPDGEFRFQSWVLAPMPLARDTDFGAPISEDDEHAFHPKLYMMLAFINTPKLIGRQQHAPHKGLAKSLKRAPLTKEFHLYPWSEIKLEISPRKAVSGEMSEARLTGGKALHFCRSHLRVRLGKIEIVSSHWRGDPALGVKLSRYKLAG